jgi:putative endonuclease
MEKVGYVYILANARYGNMYVGVTSDLVQRVWQHRGEFVDGFTKTYGIKRLVWYEIHGGIEEAIYREKQIKKWNRTWKINMVHKFNPLWRDLFDEICG